ncbi:MAG: PDDEXK nuclease domain-containing protein [Anaerolineae bacterium]|nr:PDDEXK nuclease domain-containing protein [Anaerolineae bacterium]
MPRYWVIAPYHADRPETWEKIWQFDLKNSLISIGWNELEDISGYSAEELKAAIERIYPNDSPATKTRNFNMLWDFYHNIQAGDIIIARKGRKRIAAVGTVTKTAYYSHAKNIEASGANNYYSNHIDVHWHDAPRDKVFDRIIFGMQTVYEIEESLFKSLVGRTDGAGEVVEEGIENQTEFILEKYLEDFIVTNFDQIFKGQLVLYIDPEENTVGKQYATDVGIIDILAQEPSTNSFVIIELKKGRESDRVIGQILRYMGWVSENLCKNGQTVKGIIICRDADVRLSYALKPVSNNITVKYYRVDFKLSDTPFKAV